MTGGVVSSKRLTRAERVAEALELRKAGLSFRQIEQEMEARHPGLSYGKSSIERDIKNELGRIKQESLETAEQVLALELLRLDDLQQAYWLYATGGEIVLARDESGRPTKVKQVRPSVEKAELVLKIMERRAKLMGLDKVELRVGDPAGKPLTNGLEQLAEEKLDQLIANLSASVQAASYPTPPAGGEGE